MVEEALVQTEQFLELAEQLAGIQLTISDRSTRMQTVERSIPGVWMALNPAAATPFPSSNPNRAQPLPGGRHWQSDSAERCVRRFREAGAARFFFWLSEFPNSEQIATDIQAAGMKQFGGASYPVLFRRATEVKPPPTSLEIRQFDPSRDAEAMGEYADEAVRTRVLRSADLADETYFIAWSGIRPVAAAAVTIAGSLAYLNGAGTLEAFRKRGGQSALIAARINFAANSGCTWLASETVSMLKTSLGNLQKHGFEIAFKKRVFDGENADGGKAHG